MMPLIVKYLFVGLVGGVAVAFCLLPLLLVYLIAPSRRDPNKLDLYECGVLTIGETWVRFRNQYYVYALLFLVFDIETVFLYPWAVAYGHMGLFALIEIVVFLALLTVALIYAWGRGVLRWQ